MSEETTRKKVLIVAQHFPPAGGVGSIRVTKFVKYLREFGWEPVVLTVQQDCYPEGIWLDQNLMKDIPKDVAVYRTGIWRTGFINDQGIRWLPYLLSAIGKVITKERPQLAYLTGGPFFPLMIGPFVKFRFKLPYVVDLRDPWRLARRALPRRGVKTHLGSLLTNIAEPLILRHAAAIICVSSHMCEEYQQAYPHFASKFKVVPNGYDPDDVNGVVPHHFTTFTVVYTGKFRTSEAFRDPGPFFQALRILKSWGYSIQFVHVGRVEQEVVNIAEQAGIVDLVRFIGPRPYNEALAYAKGAHVLLLIGGGQKTEQTGKIFDYIMCGRPILVLAPVDGEIAKVVNNFPFAESMPNENPEAIARVLLKMCDQNSSDIAVRDALLDTKYHRRWLTKELAIIFTETCTKYYQWREG